MAAAGFVSASDSAGAAASLIVSSTASSSTRDSAGALSAAVVSASDSAGAAASVIVSGTASVTASASTRDSGGALSVAVVSGPELSPAAASTFSACSACCSDWRTSSGFPSMISFIASMTSSITQLGVDAPAVTPIVPGTRTACASSSSALSILSTLTPVSLHTSASRMVLALV